MTASVVAIQPAYGDAWTRRQFAATLERPVILTDEPLRRQLTAAELASLTELHPTGRAACWGATRSQAAKIAQLDHGDLVLFTGQRHVQGVGRVGVVLHDGALAEAIWGLHPRRCSFEVVYTVQDFRAVGVPYPVLQEALGSSERDNFMGLRLVRDQHRVAAVERLVQHGLL